MKKIYLCMLIVAFCSCMIHAQTLHRYVVEVETGSEEDGKVLRNPFAHALDGKAMPGFYPVGQSPSDFQACTEVPAPEERDAGRLGRCQSGGCGTYRV